MLGGVLAVIWTDAIQSLLLIVDRKTRVILGAVATNVYPSVEAGAYALTNRMIFAVAQKRNPAFVPLYVRTMGSVPVDGNGVSDFYKLFTTSQRIPILIGICIYMV